MSDDLRYPIGRFRRPESVSESERNSAIEAIAALPGEFRNAVNGWTDEQLDTPYRPDGWTVRQVVHHVPDSHMNSYVRFRLALTESEPTIKPYDEHAWAALADAKSAPVEPSLELLDGLHRRWVLLLRSLSPQEWSRTFHHPDIGAMPLDINLALYKWHGMHHLAHITRLRDRMGWK
jgi:hypothetical protein